MHMGQFPLIAAVSIEKRLPGSWSQGCYWYCSKERELLRLAREEVRNVGHLCRLIDEAPIRSSALRRQKQTRLQLHIPSLTRRQRILERGF